MEIKNLKWVEPKDEKRVYGFIQARINEIYSVDIFRVQLQILECKKENVECTSLVIFGITQPLIATKLDYFSGIRNRYFSSIKEAKDFYDGLWKELVVKHFLNIPYSEQERIKKFSEAKIMSSRLENILSELKEQPNL